MSVPIDDSMPYPPTPHNVVIQTDSALYPVGKKHFKHGNNYYQLLGNTLHSDMVVCVVSDNLMIPAHRLILGTASPVLEKIVYGTENLPGSSIMNVPFNWYAGEVYEVIEVIS